MTPGTLRHDAAGATIVEFAFVAPLFIGIVIMILQAGIAFQTWNAMQNVTNSAARCLAIASPRCTTAMNGTAYTMQVGVDSGLSGLTADMVAIATTAPSRGVAYKQVSIAMPVSVLGMTITLRSRGTFPMR